MPAFEPPDHAPPPCYQTLLGEYLEYLKDYRNLAPGSIDGHQRNLVKFLRSLGPEATPEGLLGLSPKTVQEFFLEATKHHGPSARRSMAAALRTFFRFSRMRGYLSQELTQAVPPIRTYRLDRVPRGICEESLEQLLASIDRTTAVGRRDFAILQLLATYGVRGGQVRALCLRDIDWAQDQLRFPPLKGGLEVVEPLTPQVGNSLLDYLRHGRPPARWPQVFLTVRAPIRPLSKTSCLSDRVAVHLKAAGLTAPATGTHLFRHAFATRMLGHRQSLKTIADMLGHRAMQSSSIYTKVDFQTLRSVGLPWPEVTS